MTGRGGGALRTGTDAKPATLFRYDPKTEKFKAQSQQEKQR